MGGGISEGNSSKGTHTQMRHKSRNLCDTDQTRPLNAGIEIYLAVVQKDRPMETIKAGYMFRDTHRILLSRSSLLC